MINFFQSSQRSHFSDLTQREHDILQMMSLGKKNHEIAKVLDISEKTVRNHISNLFSKLGVDNRSDAILKLKTRSYEA
ncbi:MAG: LuxR C-terminal-related transcriptional regulator [Deinococcales bacterium]